MPRCLAASRLTPLLALLPRLTPAAPLAAPRNRSRFYTCSSYVLRYAALRLRNFARGCWRSKPATHRVLQLDQSQSAAPRRSSQLELQLSSAQRKCSTYRLAQIAQSASFSEQFRDNFHIVHRGEGGKEGAARVQLFTNGITVILRNCCGTIVG